MSVVLQKAVSSSGVQRDCVRLNRYINSHLSAAELEDRYCRGDPGAGNHICTTDRCNAAPPPTAATSSLVFVSAAAIVTTSSVYGALGRP